MEIDQEQMVKWLCDLVSINSVNPLLSDEGAGEAEAASYVGEALRRLGAEVRLHWHAPGRASVLGRFRGDPAKRALAFFGHLDTVGVEGMDNPFTPLVEAGRVHGRGAFDMKGSLAAALAAAQVIGNSADAGSRGDLVVAAAADEEYESLGAREIVADLGVDAAVVVEPTSMQICRAHKGFAWFEIETEGRAAHGSHFREGIDANLHMAGILTELAALEDRLRARSPHPLLGPPSLHAPLLSGGTGFSSYAARCVLGIERRTLPQEHGDDVRAELAALIETARSRNPNIVAELRELLIRDAFEVGEEAEICRSLASAYTNVVGSQAQFIGKPSWMDAAILSKAGIETVVFGPAGGGAHSSDEWVEVASTATAAAVLADLARSYTRGAREHLMESV